jgi:hypothetical protein
MKNFVCPKHGKNRWHTTVVCQRCARIYQMRSSEDMVPIPGATGMPAVCECGARLAPEDNIPGGGVYHARPMCTDCFISKLEQGEGAAS